MVAFELTELQVPLQVRYRQMEQTNECIAGTAVRSTRRFNEIFDNGMNEAGEIVYEFSA